tara:strand:+ start:146 stop:601 length:456 start_codon:yes stop_codon:yes gene_type:complete
MSKKFSIHDWQAKQRKQLLNEEVGPQSPKIDRIVESLLNVMGGRLATWQSHEQITSSHDMMALYERDKDKLRMMIYNLLRDDIKEHHDDKDFPGKNLSAWDLLDKLKSGDKELYDKVEDFMKSMKEMSMTSGGAAFGSGNSMAYMPHKKKK